MGLVVNKALIASVILLPVILVGVWIGSQNTQPKPTIKHTEEEILQVIIRDIPAFSNEGKPVAQIDSISRHDDKWYVATVKSLHPVKNFVPVKVVLLDYGKPSNNLKVVLGPSVYFSDHDLRDHGMASLNLPDSVIIELQKS